MGLSIRPAQRPEQRFHVVTIDEIFSLAEKYGNGHPALEYYFSPTKKVQFERDYVHYLNTLMLEVKHGNLDQDLYLVFVLSFQFICPLLGLEVQKERDRFLNLLEQRYGVENPELDLQFGAGDQIEEEASDEENESGSLRISEDEALRIYTDELDSSYNGRREFRESIQQRVKMDGIKAVMHWQQHKDFPELAEAFGRAIVIPSFFSMRDKKLAGFYRNNTPGIKYEVEIPEEIG